MVPVMINLASLKYLKGCDGASQNPHPSDADFVCRICLIRMLLRFTLLT